MSGYTIHATITKILWLYSGSATVLYATDGGVGEVFCCAEGWDEYGRGQWPPQVGDRIRIRMQPIVFYDGGRK